MEKISLNNLSDSISQDILFGIKILNKWLLNLMRQINPI